MMTQQRYERLDAHDVSQKGCRILEALPGQVKEEHRGRFIAIDVDSEMYFIGDTAIDATRKAQAEYPGKIFFLGRLGYRTAYTFRGRR